MEESGTMTVYRCVALQGLRYTASRSIDLTKCGALSEPTDKGERERVRREVQDEERGRGRGGEGEGEGGKGGEREGGEEEGGKGEGGEEEGERVRDGSLCDATPWPCGCPQPHLAHSLIWCALHSTPHPRSA